MFSQKNFQELKPKIFNVKRIYDLKKQALTLIDLVFSAK